MNTPKPITSAEPTDASARTMRCDFTEVIQATDAYASTMLETYDRFLTRVGWTDSKMTRSAYAEQLSPERILRRQRMAELWPDHPGEGKVLCTNQGNSAYAEQLEDKETKWNDKYAKFLAAAGVKDSKIARAAYAEQATDVLGVLGGENIPALRSVFREQCYSPVSIVRSLRSPESGAQGEHVAKIPRPGECQLALSTTTAGIVTVAQQLSPERILRRKKMAELWSLQSNQASNEQMLCQTISDSRENISTKVNDACMFGKRPSGRTQEGDGEDIHCPDHPGEGKVLCTNQGMENGVKVVKTVKAVGSSYMIASQDSYEEFLMRLGWPDSPARRAVFREQCYSPVSMKPIRSQTPSQGRMISPNPGTQDWHARSLAVTRPSPMLQGLIAAQAAISPVFAAAAVEAAAVRATAASNDRTRAAKVTTTEAQTILEFSAEGSKHADTSCNISTARHAKTPKIPRSGECDQALSTAAARKNIEAGRKTTGANSISAARGNKVVANVTDKAAAEAIRFPAEAEENQHLWDLIFPVCSDSMPCMSLDDCFASRTDAAQAAVADAKFKAVGDNSISERHPERGAVSTENSRGVTEVTALLSESVFGDEIAPTAQYLQKCSKPIREFEDVINLASASGSPEVEVFRSGVCETPSPVASPTEMATLGSEGLVTNALGASEDVKILLERRTKIRRCLCEKIRRRLCELQKSRERGVENQPGGRPCVKVTSHGEKEEYLGITTEAETIVATAKSKVSGGNFISVIKAIAATSQTHFSLDSQFGNRPSGKTLKGDGEDFPYLDHSGEGKVLYTNQDMVNVSALELEGVPVIVGAEKLHDLQLEEGLLPVKGNSVADVRIVEALFRKRPQRSGDPNWVKAAEAHPGALTAAFGRIRELSLSIPKLTPTSQNELTLKLGSRTSMVAEVESTSAFENEYTQVTADMAAKANSNKTAVLGAAADATDADNAEVDADTAAEAAQVWAANVDWVSPTALQGAGEANSANAVPPPLSVVVATQAIEVAPVATLQAAAAEVQAAHVIEVAKAETLQAAAAEVQAAHATGEEAIRTNAAAIRTNAAAVDVEDNFNAEGFEGDRAAEPPLVKASFEDTATDAAKVTGAEQTTEAEAKLAGTNTVAVAMLDHAGLPIAKNTNAITTKAESKSVVSIGTEVKAATIVVPHMANAGSVDTNTVPAKAIAVGVAVVDETSAYASEADLAGASMVADQAGWWIENARPLEVAVVTGFSDDKAELKFVVATAAELKSVVAGAVGAIADEVELKSVVVAGTGTLEQAGSLTWKDTSLMVAAAEAIAAKAEFKSGVIKGSEVKTANIVHQPTQAGCEKDTPTTDDLSKHRDCFREEILHGSKCLKHKTLINSQDVVVGTVGTIAKQPEFKLGDNVSASHASAENATEAKSNWETKAVDVTTNARGVQIMEADFSANKAIGKAITAGVEAKSENESALSGNREASTISIIREAADIVCGQNKAAERTGVQSCHKVSHMTSYIARLNEQFGKRPAGNTLEGGGEYTCCDYHDYTGYPSENKAFVIKQGVENLLDLVFKDETVQVQAGKTKRSAVVFTDKATAGKGKLLVVQLTKVPVDEAKFCVLSVADAVIFPAKATVEHSAHAAADTAADVAVDAAAQGNIDRGSPTTLQSAGETNSANAAHAAPASGNEYTQVTVDAAVEATFTKSVILGAADDVAAADDADADAADAAVADAAQVPAAIVDRGFSNTLQIACEVTFVNAGPLAAPLVVAATREIEVVTKAAAEAEKLSFKQITSLSQVATCQALTNTVVDAGGATTTKAEFEFVVTMGTEVNAATIVELRLATAAYVDADIVVAETIALAEAIPTSDAARLTADEDMFKTAVNARGNLEKLATPNVRTPEVAVVTGSREAKAEHTSAVDGAVGAVVNEVELKSVVVGAVGAQVNGANTKLNVVGPNFVAAVLDQDGSQLQTFVVVVNGARSTRTDDKFNVIVEPHLANVAFVDMTTSTVNVIAAENITDAEDKFAGANLVVAGTLGQAGSQTAAEAFAAKAELKSGVIKGSEVKTATSVHQPTQAGCRKDTPTAEDLSHHMDYFSERSFSGSECLERKTLTNSLDVAVGTAGTMAKQPEFKLEVDVSASQASAEKPATEAKYNLETKAVDVTNNARGVQITEANFADNKTIDQAITPGVEAKSEDKFALTANRKASTVSITVAKACGGNPIADASRLTADDDKLMSEGSVGGNLAKSAVAAVVVAEVSVKADEANFEANETMVDVKPTAAEAEFVGANFLAAVALDQAGFSIGALAAAAFHQACWKIAVVAKWVEVDSEADKAIEAVLEATATIREGKFDGTDSVAAVKLEHAGIQNASKMNLVAATGDIGATAGTIGIVAECKCVDVAAVTRASVDETEFNVDANAEVPINVVKASATDAMFNILVENTQYTAVEYNLHTKLAHGNDHIGDTMTEKTVHTASGVVASRESDNTSDASRAYDVAHNVAQSKATLIDASGSANLVAPCELASDVQSAGKTSVRRAGTTEPQVIVEEFGCLKIVHVLQIDHQGETDGIPTMVENDTSVLGLVIGQEETSIETPTMEDKTYLSLKTSRTITINADVDTDAKELKISASFKDEMKATVEDGDTVSVVADETNSANAEIVAAQDTSVTQSTDVARATSAVARGKAKAAATGLAANEVVVANMISQAHGAVFANTSAVLFDAKTLNLDASGDTMVKIVQYAEIECNLHTKLAVIDNINISGAMVLRSTDVLVLIISQIIQIIGRWASNAFQCYTRFKVEIMRDVSRAMVRTGFAIRSN